MAETDTEKVIALEEFTAENDDDFEHLPSRIQDRSTHIMKHELEITAEDIVDKLAKLKLNKSPGLDLLHPRVLYETWEIIASAIFNLH